VTSGLLFIVFLAGVLPLAALGFVLGRRKPLSATESGPVYHSSPDYCGWYAVVWMFVPAVLVSFAALAIDTAGWYPVSGYMMLGAWLALPALALLPVVWTITPNRRARNIVERFVYGLLIATSLVSILTTIAITLSVLFEAIRFFQHPAVDIGEFLFGTTWSPGASFVQSGSRAGEQSADPEFGSVPLFAGTFMISAIAMLTAVPIGVMAAVYMSEYAPRSIRKVAKPLLEVLAGIPTVVYGFFAAITLAPFIVWLPQQVGVEASYQNALAPGIIMGVMIIPFMSSLSDDVISAVPHDLRRGAFALGATDAEVAKWVVLPAAIPGIISAFLISVSRAVGETMIVVMAAGQAANLTPNPLESMTTVTVQIVSSLTGDQRFDHPMTLSAFGLGFTLLVITLILNIISAVVIRKFHRKYE